MITFPYGITDEEIETLSEQAQEDVDNTFDFDKLASSSSYAAGAAHLYTV